MAYYPRVFYENGDGTGGGGGDPNRAAAALADSVEQQEKLTAQFEARRKAEEEARIAREEGNETLARQIEEQNRLKAQQAGITQQQLDLMQQRIDAQEQLAEAERQAAEESEREAEEQVRLLEEQQALQEGVLGFAKKILDSIKKQTAELDKQRVALGKNTGLFGQFNDQLVNSVAMAAKFGKGQEAVRSTIGSLSKDMMNFTQLSDDNQKTLIDGSLALQQFGIEAAQSAKANDFLMNSLGKSAKEAVSYQKDLVELGHEIGMSGSLLVEQFGSMSGDLAKFGDKAEDVFKNLAKTAKATGVEMNTLLGVAKQFDTFEGAASAVGKLNAQMGTNLDAMTLLQEEDPAKQVEMLRDAFQATGKDLASMSKFERMAAAEAMGMTLPDLQKFLQPKKEKTQTDKDFDDLIKLTTTFGDKLSAVGKQFAVFFTPVISIMVDVLDFIGRGISLFSEFTQKISENKAIVYSLATVLGVVLLPLLAQMLATTLATISAKIVLFFERARELVQTYMGIAAKLKDNIVMSARLALTIANTAATQAWSFAVFLATQVTNLFNAAGLVTQIRLIATTALQYAQVAAIGAYNFVVGLATMATWLFNAALLANPIGLVILGVVALVGALYLLWENMGEIGSFFGDIWDGIAAKFEWLIDKVVTGAEKIKNTVTGVLCDEPQPEEVPALAEGTPNFEGGRALVGEKGPEMVNLPRGAEVVPNNKLQSAENNVAQAKAAGEEKPPVIKLMLNERELGSAVLDVINKKLDVFSAFS